MFREIFESIKKMSDKNIDNFIQNNWNGKAVTLPYVFEASVELGQQVDVLVSSDKKFMHIKTGDKTLVDFITKKYNIKELDV